MKTWEIPCSGGAPALPLQVKRHVFFDGRRQVLHSLSVRARGGEPRAALERLARSGVDLLLS